MLGASTVTAMQVGKCLLGLVAAVATSGLVASCTFPTPSQDYVCKDDSDCDPERVCSAAKYCVLRSTMADAGAGSDAAPMDSTQQIDADPFAATRAACIAANYTLDATTNGYYRKVTNNTNWTNATTDCNDDVAGATHMITLSTDAEVNFQKSLSGAWIGWIDRPTEGTWHAVTAEVPTINYQTYWAGSRPDGGGDENCAIWRNNSPTGIDDVECSQGHPYICECDGMAVLP